MRVDFGIFLFMGFPILSLRYKGGSSHGLAGLSINSAMNENHDVIIRRDGRQKKQDRGKLTIE